MKWSKILKLWKSYIIFTSPIGGADKKRGSPAKIATLSLFVKTSPINDAVATGNGNNEF